MGTTEIGVRLRWVGPVSFNYGKEKRVESVTDDKSGGWRMKRTVISAESCVWIFFKIPNCTSLLSTAEAIALISAFSRVRRLDVVVIAGAGFDVRFPHTANVHTYEGVQWIYLVSVTEVLSDSGKYDYDEGIIGHFRLSITRWKPSMRLCFKLIITGDKRPARPVELERENATRRDPGVPCAKSYASIASMQIKPNGSQPDHAPCP